MQKQKEALFHSLAAEDIAEGAKERLPESEPHRSRAWDLATQILFPTTTRVGNGLRLVGAFAAGAEEVARAATEG